MKKIRHLMMAGLLSAAIGVSGQETEKLTVTTLNVDGLPQKILVFNVNANGPGAEGTSRIGKYLKKKDFDIVCMQEDFNYHGVLTPWLEDDYTFDEWSGAVGLDMPDAKIDLLHVQNVQFPCDGLGACWKKGIVVNSSERVAWKQGFGKFSHAADEFVTKGFRRSELTLASGVRIIVYNMHMDADYIKDRMEGKDTKDREARLSQWLQLREDVLAHLDTRPIIIVGDMNSYYCRDQIKEQFIDQINATGRGTASDVWVELERQGAYPAPKEGIIFTEEEDNILDGETLDKILYINPATGTQLKAVAFRMDRDDYRYEDKTLGDHYPLVATFEVCDRNAPAGIEAVSTTAADDAEYYNLNGQRVNQPAKGLYIEHQGQESRKRIMK